MRALSHYSALLLLLWSCHTSRESQAPPISPAYNLPANENTPNPVAFGQLVDRYEAPTRMEWQQPDRIIARMGPLAGRRIADIGAGTGFFSFRLARAGAEVIAIDIDPRFLQFIEQRRQEWPDSIAQRLTLRPADPELPPLSAQEVDGVLLVNTYAYLPNRPRYFKYVHDALQPDGWLLVVDYKAGPQPVGPDAADKLPTSTIIAELEASGFHHMRVEDQVLPYQNLIWAFPTETDTLVSTYNTLRQ